MDLQELLEKLPADGHVLVCKGWNRLGDAEAPSTLIAKARVVAIADPETGDLTVVKSNYGPLVLD